MFVDISLVLLMYIFIDVYKVGEKNVFFNCFFNKD